MGAKPEHAFYVAVGLGKTMSAQDILDGHMIVEVGLAHRAAGRVHRPAVHAEDAAVLSAT